MASRYINERDRTLYGVNYDLLDGLTLTQDGFPAMEPLRDLPKVDEVIEINRVITNKGRPGNQRTILLSHGRTIWKCHRRTRLCEAVPWSRKAISVRRMARRWNLLFKRHR